MNDDVYRPGILRSAYAYTGTLIMNGIFWGVGTFSKLADNYNLRQSNKERENLERKQGRRLLDSVIFD